MLKKAIHLLEELCERLEGVPATVVSGIFLLFDLIPHTIGEFTGTEVHGLSFLPFDPAWVTVVISGLPLLYSAVKRLIRSKGISKISSALLISIAMIAAISIGDLFAAGEVAFIMAIGEILEHKTTERAKRGLKKLIGLAPQQGRRVVDGKEELIPADQIRVGDIVRILPGETVPVDGEIVSGSTSVDQSIMTGESLPVDKEVGDSVFCGTINRFGSVDIQAAKVGEDSSLQRLIRMVREAEDKQAPMQRVADRWASYLVPAALVLAVIAGLVKQDLVVAVTILVVFCPCALVLATPTAIMAAIGQATRHGVIIKSGEALEKLGKVDTVAFDKTGTITYGKLEVSDLIPLDPSLTPDKLLALTAAAERRSEHPLGKAIVERAGKEGFVPAEPEDFSMEAGKGVRARVAGTEVYCGSEKYIIEKNIPIPTELADALSALRNEGKASVVVAAGGVCVGVVALSDVLRPDAADMITRLEGTGVQTVLLTGDNEQTARYFAAQAGISDVRAGLLPEDKVAAVTGLAAAGKLVCMIGDGVNDAPALKTAEVGVAMGTMGSDIAIEAADVALMGDDISKLPYLKKLANATVRTIKVAISLSLLINFAAIILSFLEVLTPTTGALVHNAGAIFVVLIAAFLYDRKFT